MSGPAQQSLDDRIAALLASGRFAVIGASADRSRYGNKVLRWYQQHGREVHPIDPKAREAEGLPAFPSLAALPVPVPAISDVTPPAAGPGPAPWTAGAAGRPVHAG